MKHIFLATSYLFSFIFYPLCADSSVCKEGLHLKSNVVAIQDAQLEKLILENPDNLDCLYFAANEKFKKGQVMDGFELIAKIDSKDKTFLRNKEAHKVVKIALALKELKDGAQQNQDYEKYNQIADIFFEMGLLREAEKFYKTSISINQNQPKIALSLGICYGFDNKFYQAAQEFQNAIKLDYSNFYAHYYLAKILKNNIQNIDQSLEHYGIAYSLLQKEENVLDKKERDFFCEEIKKELSQRQQGK